MSDIALTVDNKIHRGWTAMRAERSIEQAAGVFGLSVSDRFPGQPEQWIIEPGAECALELDGAIVITGYVDKTERSMDARGREMQVHGRDKISDIIDCAALLPGDKITSMNNVSLSDAAEKLVGPHNIYVIDKVGTPKRSQWSIGADGETIWENLARFARQEAVLIVSDAKGGITITRAGGEKHKTSLVEGKNILSVKFSRDESQRFHRYLFLAQNSTDGGLDNFDLEIANPRSVVVDDFMRSNRVSVIISESLADGVTLKQRAEWEKNFRRARSRRVTIRVQGWSSNGELWQPNYLVNVQVPSFGLGNVDLLIVSVAYSLDRQGTLTDLTLSPADAYDLLPEAVDESGQDDGLLL